MAICDSANGATDSRPVFFFDIDNCVCDSLATSYVFHGVSLANDHTHRSFIRKVRAHLPPKIDQILTSAGCNIHDDMQKLISGCLSLSSDDAQCD